MQAEGFAQGARLLVTGLTTGAVEFAAERIVDEDAPVAQARKGACVTIKVPEKVRENDKLYVLEQRQ